MSGHLQLIGGAWCAAVDGSTRQLVDPATEQPIDTVPYGGAADADAAIEAASAAGTAWAAATPYERAAVLERAASLIEERADRFAPITTEESGKPITESLAEWRSAPNYLRFAAGAAVQLTGRAIAARVSGRRIDVVYRPIGVVGVIAAWNFPVYNVNRAVASALAAGCTVVVRPSSSTPRSAMRYAAALQDAGLPAGVLNVVNGDADAIAQRMLDDRRVRKIQFTGSDPVGRRLMDGASRTVTRLSLELGGNAPVIVFPDAGDLEALAAGAVAAKFRNAGQACIAPQRFLVHRSIVDDFTESVAAAASRLRVGPPAETATQIGPLVTAAHRSRIEAMVADSVDAGARVVVGGSRPEGRGWFYLPTVMHSPPETRVMREEVFGPVLPITGFDTVAEAVALANDTEMGLAAFVMTADLHTALDVSGALEAGLIGINDWYPVAPEAPFGGVKQSGVGRESGTEGLLEYLETTTRYFGGS